MEKLTNSGKAMLATISADGKYVVYAMDEGKGQESLWMRHIATGSNAQIMPPAEVRYTGLTFTPSGDFLYFQRSEPDRPGLGFLYQIPVLGGTPRKVIDDVDSAVSFSPDGKHMVFLRDSSSDATSKIIIANPDGSGEHALASLPLPGYTDPAWSPDGKWIAATVLDPGSENLGRVVLLDAVSGKEKTIYASTAILNKPTWMPDGQHLLLIFHDISSEWNGQVGEISVSSGKLHRITNDLNSYSQRTLSVTSDGKQLVAIQVTPEGSIYTLSSEPNSGGNPVAIDNHNEIDVGWLPDGRLLAMTRDGQIATMKADGSDRNVIFQEHQPMGSLSVCPDGQRAIFVMANKDTRAINVWNLDLQSGKASPLTNGKVDQNPVCSPDSKFFVYSGFVNGRQMMMEKQFAGGEPKQLSDKLIQLAAISPDAKQITMLTVVGNGINFHQAFDVIPAQGGLPIKSFPSSPFLSSVVRYSPDGEALYYAVTVKGVSNLVMQPIGSANVTPVTNFTDLNITGYDYDWKNKKLAVARGNSNLDLVLIKQQ